jgi:GDPmannose 4,6-dehydratase
LRFVTQKIITASKRIANGSVEKLRLGRLDIARDWGWAPEYVDAMWRMLQQERPDDFVIATGKTYSLEQFVTRAFAHYGLNWRDYVEQDEELFRPADISISVADPSKAARELKWKARYQMPDIVEMMLQGENPKKN